MKTAVIIGSTGLIGNLLLEKLVQSSDFHQIIAIMRSKKSAQNPVFSNPKVRSLYFDFQNWTELSLQVEGFSRNTPVTFFCCLGTTMAKAGSQEAFRKVDHNYIVEFAKMAQKCKAEQLLVVSALGADRNSEIFYNRTKGETENDVQGQFSGKLHLLRPSLLLGDRSEVRIGEKIAVLLSPVFSVFMQGPLAKYKPIEAVHVAQAMLEIATKKVNASVIVTNEEMEAIAKGS
ncbi:MAG: hypothetical protein K0R29_420 [Pseudobdellovibrio sp.]|jgi:uncharacterized protein YbjT (DUF2867 family)|nr:hypothetical protein [Pseudobdellovibrio sp.]